MEDGMNANVRQFVGPQSIGDKGEREEVPSGGGTYVGPQSIGDKERSNPGPILFQPFVPTQAVRIYRRHLPHWRQEGATYFVTFRLADSIPRPVAEGWDSERVTWYQAHGLSVDLSDEVWESRYRAIAETERRAFERDQAKRLFAELDRCHGGCHLRSPEASSLVTEALHFFDGQRLRCGDYVTMPNHLHWLVQPCPGEELEELLRSVKSYTARRINAHLGRSGPFWQKENYDHIVRDTRELSRTREYIAANPAKAGLPEVDAQRFCATWTEM
jgi:type I restriction enzyme R subunit